MPSHQFVSIYLAANTIPIDNTFVVGVELEGDAQVLAVLAEADLLLVHVQVAPDDVIRSVRVAVVVESPFIRLLCSAPEPKSTLVRS